SSGAGRTSDGNGSHASTLKSPSYTKSVSWQHYQKAGPLVRLLKFIIYFLYKNIHNGYSHNHNSY
ncbi:transposase, partial [Klebsiella pneumoniae]